MRPSDSSFSPPRSERLGLLRLAAFTSPVILFQTIELAWRVYLPSTLAGTAGLSLTTVGAIMLGARLLDATADPVVGWLSDRSRLRIGRRKPWMIAGVPMVALGALLLFCLPISGLATVVGASALLHLGYSLIITPHGGWALELSDDRRERTLIMGAKVWVAVAGSIGLVALLALLERFAAFDKRSLVTVIGLAIAVMAFVTVAIVCMGFRERMLATRAPSPGPFALIRAMAGNTEMRRVLVLYVLSGVADASVTSMFLFTAEDGLGLTGWGSTMLLIQPVVTLVALPLWAKYSHRAGRRRTLLRAYGWQALIAPAIIVVPAGEPLAFAGLLVLRSLSWGVDYMLLRAMVADIAVVPGSDGTANSASYYGVTSVTLKIAMGVGAGLTLWFVGMAGFRPGHGITPPDIALALRTAFALPPALAGSMAVLILLRPQSFGEPSASFAS